MVSIKFVSIRDFAEARRKAALTAAPRVGRAVIASSLILSGYGLTAGPLSVCADCAARAPARWAFCFGIRGGLLFWSVPTKRFGTRAQKTLENDAQTR